MVFRFFHGLGRTNPEAIGGNPRQCVISQGEGAGNVSGTPEEENKVPKVALQGLQPGRTRTDN